MRERDLEIALRRLIEAEERFVSESGVPLVDDVSEAVSHARKVLGMKPSTSNDREPTAKAIQACGEWLATCLELGWPREHLDALEKLWWTYHDDGRHSFVRSALDPHPRVVRRC